MGTSRIMLNYTMEGPENFYDQTSQAVGEERHQFSGNTLLLIVSAFEDNRSSQHGLQL